MSESSKEIFAVGLTVKLMHQHYDFLAEPLEEVMVRLTGN
jgi:hypothetical protein